MSTFTVTQIDLIRATEMSISYNIGLYALILRSLPIVNSTSRLALVPAHSFTETLITNNAQQEGDSPYIAIRRIIKSSSEELSRVVS